MSDLFREYPKPEFVLPEKWCIRSENFEQHCIIVDYFKEISENNSAISLYAWQYQGGFYFHKPFYSSRCAFEFKLDEYTKITFEQFVKYVLKKEFVFPEKWCIKENNEQQNISISKFIGKDCKFNPLYRYYIHFPNHNNLGWRSPFKETGYEEITFEQFEKYIIKKENMKMKKILGYKIIKPQYIKASEIITNFPGLFDEKKQSSLPEQGIHFTAGSACAMSLRAAGVLDLWFEPVCEEEIIVLSLGSPEKTNIKISKGKIVVEGDNVIQHNQLRDINLALNSLDYNQLHGTKKSYNVEFHRTVKIGCTTFTQEEVKKVLDTYDSLK